MDSSTICCLNFLSWVKRKRWFLIQETKSFTVQKLLYFLSSFYIIRNLGATTYKLLFPQFSFGGCFISRGPLRHRHLDGTHISTLMYNVSFYFFFKNMQKFACHDIKVGYRRCVTITNAVKDYPLTDHQLTN